MDKERKSSEPKSLRGDKTPAQKSGLFSVMPPGVVGAAEIEQFENNLHSFISTIESAVKESREDIFKRYGNELKPIAYIPKEYLQYFKGTATDNRIYTGLGYFIDHAVNSHSDVQKSDYEKIQEILNNPDDIIIDRREDPRSKQEKDNLLFIKKYSKNIILVVQLESNDKRQILLHKSFHYAKNNTPYPSLPRAQGLRSGGGRSPIGRVEQTTPGGILSTLDNTIIGNFIEPVKARADSISKPVDENSEPKV